MPATRRRRAQRSATDNKRHQQMRALHLRLEVQGPQWFKVREIPRLPGQGLRPPPDFGFASLAQGIDRPAAQGFIRGKQPGNEFLVGIAGVREDHNRSLKALYRMTVLDEFGRNATDSAFTDPQCSQRTFIKKRVDLGNRNVQALRDIGKGQPFAHKAFYITHGSRLPCRQALRLVDARLLNGHSPDAAHGQGAASATDTPRARIFRMSNSSCAICPFVRHSHGSHL